VRTLTELRDICLFHFDIVRGEERRLNIFIDVHACVWRVQMELDNEILPRGSLLVPLMTHMKPRIFRSVRIGIAYMGRSRRGELGRQALIHLNEEKSCKIMIDAL